VLAVLVIGLGIYPQALVTVAEPALVELLDDVSAALTAAR